MDYLALGDWHGHLTVGDRTAYSGTPETDRFGRDEPGACIAVDLRSGEAPQLRKVETGRYRWLSRRWNVANEEDLERELATLRTEARLSDVLLSLTLSGVASLSDRVSIIALLENRVGHELRHLDLNADELIARPTTDDIARIDVQGALAGATSTLRSKAEANGSEAQVAAAALERLYVEALRFDAEVSK